MATAASSPPSRYNNNNNNSGAHLEDGEAPVGGGDVLGHRHAHRAQRVDLGERDRHGVQLGAWGEGKCE